MNKKNVIIFVCVFFSFSSFSTRAARLMENLDRGVVAVKKYNGVYVGWRMLGTEPQTVGYNIYRGSVKVNSSPITNSTNYVDYGGTLSSKYSVAAVVDGIEEEKSSPVSVWSDFYHDIPLNRPAAGTTPDGFNYTYSPNDASVGDLDGDGQYEIVLKWDPSNARDNSADSYTGNVYLDAYDLDGSFLWRIDLGINIQAGPHYTQFLVYDFNGDGVAEIVCKTADGTIDGQGDIIGNPTADWRNSNGAILDGPEYLSIFDGQTGAVIDTVDYVPPRGNICDWGDCYGNRVDRFLACVAYLDGKRPSIVMSRGYYTRAVLAAWDFRDGQLTSRWVFDSDDGYPSYAGQGNHNLSVGDVDGDTKDEIVFGSCTIDDDGTGLYSTGLGHGDAMHLSDMDPSRPGLEVWQCHETAASGATFRDAATGEVLINHVNSGDVGRACAAHIDARYPGYQLWSYAQGGVYNVDGSKISDNYSGKMMNFLIWWDADLQREFLDAADCCGGNPVLEKWGGNGSYRVLSLYSIPTAYSTSGNNWSKANPCLSGDIIGDWREEVIYRSSDNTKLRLFINTDLTSHRIYTLMHDPQYRLAIAWQNVGYNQPPHPGFYLGAGMDEPPKPDIILAGGDPDETDPPRPNPMAWAQKPHVSGNNSILMQAASAVDAHQVEYYFDCTLGPGHDSGWQTSEFYEDTRLFQGQTYMYAVKARDKSNNHNVTIPSAPASCILPKIPAVAHWNFEDGTAGQPFFNMPAQGSADTVSETVMYGYSLANGPSFSTDTPNGRGLSAYCSGGQDGYTLDAELNAWSPAKWTIEVSVKLTDISGWRTILGRDGSSYGDRESDFYLQINDDADADVPKAFRLNMLTAGGDRHVLDADFAVAANRWYYLAVTCDGTAIKMYCDKLDGNGYQLVGALDISAQTPSQNQFPGSGFIWTFGRGWYNGNAVDYVAGYFDNVRLSNEALAPEEFLGSRSNSVVGKYGDFTGDRYIDYEDLAVMFQIWQWQDCEALTDFDMNDDCSVSLVELCGLASNWLKTSF